MFSKNKAKQKSAFLMKKIFTTKKKEKKNDHACLICQILASDLAH